MGMVTKAECDVFPRSRDPIKLYRLSIVEVVDDKSVDPPILYTHCYLGNRALIRLLAFVDRGTLSPSHGNAEEPKTNDVSAQTFLEKSVAPA